MNINCVKCFGTQSGVMEQRSMEFDGRDVKLNACRLCGSVWLDAEACAQLGVSRRRDVIAMPGDIACPNCASKFLDAAAVEQAEDLETAACSHCGGVLIGITEEVLKRSAELTQTPFGTLVTDLALLRKVERQARKKNKLPATFAIENARETDFKCPSCESPLTLYRVFDRTKRTAGDFEICDTCYGIWLDKEDLRLEGTDNSRQSALEVDFESIVPGQKACPKCRDISLISMKFKSVETVIDCCPSCFGTWLDGGELKEFADHLNKHDYDVINALADNAVFHNPSLCHVLRQFSRALHNLDTQVQDQARNLEHAREIQEKLLFGPDSAEIMRRHQHGSYEIAQHWQPAKQVGGDYFDLIPFETNGASYLGVCVADVSGKGLPASLLMANFQALLRSFAPKNTSPKALCTELNHVLYLNTTPNKYITAVYGVLNLATHEFTYTNAGHEQPIHLGGTGIHFLKTGGTVLGLFPKWDFQEETVVLSPGDRLVLYTDGISEAGDPKQEAFEADRLGDLALEHHTEHVVDLHARLVRAVREFCVNQFHDDATLLVLGR